MCTILVIPTKSYKIAKKKKKLFYKSTQKFLQILCLFSFMHNLKKPHITGQTFYFVFGKCVFFQFWHDHGVHRKSYLRFKN